MRVWLSQRKAGLEVVPNPDDPTSVLRPSRAVTVAEKMEAKKRKSMSKASGERERKHNKELTALQETAAAEGCVVDGQSASTGSAGPGWLHTLCSV